MSNTTSLFSSPSPFRFFFLLFYSTFCSFFVCFRPSPSIYVCIFPCSLPFLAFFVHESRYSGTLTPSPPPNLFVFLSLFFPPYLISQYTEIPKKNLAIPIRYFFLPTRIIIIINYTFFRSNVMVYHIMTYLGFAVCTGVCFVCVVRSLH